MKYEKNENDKKTEGRDKRLKWWLWSYVSNFLVSFLSDFIAFIFRLILLLFLASLRLIIDWLPSYHLVRLTFLFSFFFLWLESSMMLRVSILELWLPLPLELLWIRLLNHMNTNRRYRWMKNRLAMLCTLSLEDLLLLCLLYFSCRLGRIFLFLIWVSSSYFNSCFIHIKRNRWLDRLRSMMMRWWCILFLIILLLSGRDRPILHIIGRWCRLSCFLWWLWLQLLK